MADKFAKVEGVLNALPVKTGDRKDGGKYEKQQLVLEINGYYEDKDGTPHNNTYLMLFDLSRRVKENLDLYNIGDPIILSYTMKGRSYPKKDGSRGYDNAIMAVSIEHSAINSGTRKPAKAEIEKEQIPVDNENMDDLPF